MNYPSCFCADGSFDMVRLSEFLKDKIDISQEGYELKFLDKNYAKCWHLSIQISNLQLMDTQSLSVRS